MEDNFEHLSKDIEVFVGKLNEKSQPMWGEMNVGEMINHLSAGVEMTLSFKEFPITTPEDKLSAYLRFLMSDRDFGNSAPKPKEFLKYENKEGSDLEKTKQLFLDLVNRFKKESESNPDYWAVHPSFGKLNAEQTRQLHFKHITHHFKQFGVLD